MSSKMLILFLIIGGIIALVDSVLGIGHSDTLLFTLVFWVAIVEGCVALVAAVEASVSPWIKSIKKELLSVHPLILFFAILFIFLIPKMHFYPWISKNNFWLNKTSFLIRNVLVLLLTYAVARKYSKESLNESPKKNFYAVVYLFVFVLSQSMVAFDWVMSLEYPWVSSLFGGYFFIESLYTGLAAAGIILFFLYKSMGEEAFQPYKKVLRDVSLMMFGTSMLWGGLFYSQFLVIWYGHLPEESSFFIRRMAEAPYRQIMISIVPLLFGVPFIVLLSKPIKTKPYGILFLSLVVLTGIFLERWVMMRPNVPLNLFLTIIEFIGIAFLFAKLSFQDKNTPGETA